MDVDVCRICLMNMGTIDIYDNTLCGIAICSKIMYCCANIHFSKEDGLPGRICSICDMELSRAYKFILKCEAADRKLHALNQKEDCVKFEVDVEEDNIIERDDSSSDEPCSNSTFEEKQDEESLTENPVPIVENVKNLKIKNKLKAQCKECGMQCDSQSTLNIHKLTHNNNKLHALNQKEDCVKLEVNVEEDNLIERDNSFSDEPCSNSTFEEKQDEESLTENPVPIVENVKNLKNKNKLKVQCKECGMQCDSQSTLNIHKLTHNNKLYACHSCDKTYKTKRVLSGHIEVNHNPDRKREFICEFCGKAFYTKSDVKRHMRSHTGEKPYACSDCPSKFTQNGALRRHQLLHTGEKRHSCDKCNKKFSTKVELKRHEFVHTTEQKFKCIICNARYKHLDTLKLHVLQHTSTTSVICDYCDKTFKTKNNLRNHINNLHFNKPGTCHVCSKNVHNIKSHMRTHQRKRQWKCGKNHKRTKRN